MARKRAAKQRDPEAEAPGLIQRSRLGNGDATPSTFLRGDQTWATPSGGSSVPTTRVITTTTPVRIDGGASADLSVDRTLSILAATTSAQGSVELATSGENAADRAVQGNDARINVVTTKGDIYTASAANTPARLAVGTNDYLLQAASGETTGLKYTSPLTILTKQSGLSGRWMYGDGSDGDLTLVAATVLADDDNVKAYNDLDLAGYGLYCYDSSDGYIVIQVNGTLDGNGGQISSINRSAINPGSRDTAAGTAYGGAGGRGAAAAWVFAKTVLDVDIRANASQPASPHGLIGAEDGQDGVTATTTTTTGAGNPATNTTVYAIAGDQMTATGPGSLASGAGGAGGTITAGGSIELARRASKDLLRLVLGQNQTPVFAAGDSRQWAAGSGGSGGHSHSRTGGAAAPIIGPGGGGGAPGCYGLGGNGGAGGPSANCEANSYGNTGGGGGGGGGGGLACLICDDASGTVSVEAKGGDGGSGGDGFNESVSPQYAAHGGGGGGGGGGGVVIAVGPSLISVSVANGVHGAGGVGSGVGTNGTAGGTITDSQAGKSWDLTKV